MRYVMQFLVASSKLRIFEVKDMMELVICVVNGMGYWYANLIALAIARVVDRAALRNTGLNHRERRLFKN
jgi:C4-dicarboxylate transporter